MGYLGTGASLAFLKEAFGEPRGGCILWPYSLTRNGYPQMSYMGKQRRAHQVVLELAGKVRGPGQVARHLCGIRACVNVDHLEWSTQSENLRDTRRHGTNPRVNQTHCKSGHPFDEVNTKIRKDGNRDCRACNAAASRKYRRSRNG